MDLITGLPMHWGKDAILTIVDHGCSDHSVKNLHKTGSPDMYKKL
jgi:hypothetical protein